MSNISIFNFKSNEVRTIVDSKNEAWFLANDVCAILDYKNPRDAVSRHCKEGGVAKHDTPVNGMAQEMIYINEPNLWRLIIKSRKKEAEVIEAWVMEEVLPSIRKTGSYTIPQLATAAQKQHLKSLVSDRVSKTGLHFQKVWTAVQEANGFNRLDNLTPQSYAKSCAYFKADPIGLNPDDWAHAPVALPQSQPATFKVPDGMMLIPRTAALNLWSMAKQLTSGIDALGMIDGDMPKWLVA